MKQLAVAALRGMLWIVGIVVVPGGLLVAGNAFDERLNPEAAAYLKPDAPSQLPDDHNAYFTLVGLGARASEQPHEAGRKWVGAVEDAVAKRSRGESAAWPKAGSARSAPELCVPGRSSCIAAAREKEGEARKLVADFALLLARYRALLGYPGYAEPMEYSDVEQPFPPFTPVISAQRAFHLDAALRLAQGETDAVLAELEKEIAFLRRMLAGSDLLIGKMVANRLLQRSTLMASDVLARHREAAASRAASLAQALQPLSAQERQMDTALRHEFRFQKNGFDLMLRYPGLTGESWIVGWARLFYQPNATANLELPYRKAALDAAALPATALAAPRKQAGKPPDPPVWMAWYNPVGKILVLPSLKDLTFEHFILSMHDLDGLVRLVALQSEIVAKGVKDENVPQFIAAADTRYSNPWTEKPMQWDAKARQLYFEPRSKRYQDDKTGGAAGRVAVTL
jgi:hypothetical protein